MPNCKGISQKYGGKCSVFGDRWECVRMRISSPGRQTLERCGTEKLLCQAGGKERSRAASAGNNAVGRQRFARNAAITPVIMFPWRSRRKALAPAAFPFCAGNAAGFAFCRARSALEKVNPPLEGRALRNRVQRGHALWISRTGSGRSLHRQCCRRCRTRSRCRCRQLPRPAPQPAAGQR